MTDAHGIAQGRVLMQDLHVQLIRSPLPVRRAAAGRVFASTVRDRALAIFIHDICSFSCVAR